MRRPVGRVEAWHCNWLKLRLSGETGEEGGGEGWVLSSSIEVFGNTWKYNLRSTSIKQSRKFHGAVNLRFCSMKTVRIYLPWMLYSTKCRLARQVPEFLGLPEWRHDCKVLLHVGPWRQLCTWAGNVKQEKMRSEEDAPWTPRWRVLLITADQVNIFIRVRRLT